MGRWRTGMELTPEERALLAPLEIRFFTWAGSTRTFDAAAAEWESVVPPDLSTNGSA